MKKLIVFALICSLPFLVMVAVNEIPDNPEPSHRYIPERCTWHCHNVTCKHWKTDYKAAPTKTKQFHKDVFDWYVESLHNNWLGLDYGAINLLVFFGLYPLLGGWLLWRLLTHIIS